MKDSFADKMLKPINPVLVTVLGIYTATWGLWILSPWWTAFSDDLHAPVRPLLNLMPEWFWGSIAFLTGTIATLGILRGSDVARIRGIQGMATHWFVVTIFYVIGDWHSTAWITTLMLSLYATLVMINFKVNAKIFDKKKELENDLH